MEDTPMELMRRLLTILLFISSTGAIADTFDGNDCTEDCSGHEAGYQWAEDNEIDDAVSCSTPSNSFNEGCESYVEENEEDYAADEDY
jgi:hypothetical protein